MRHLFSLIGIAGLAVTPAVANPLPYCYEMWFARNMAFNQAGYCFASPLGQALFDNSDCTGQEVTLTPDQQWIVDYARRQETELGCNIDTSATTLPIDGLDWRLRLVDIAPADEWGGWLCIDYQGPPFNLRIGHGAGMAEIAPVMAGDSLSVDFDTSTAPEGWDLYIAKRDDAVVGVGWGPTIRRDGDCRYSIP